MCFCLLGQLAGCLLCRRCGWQAWIEAIVWLHALLVQPARQSCFYLTSFGQRTTNAARQIQPHGVHVLGSPLDIESCLLDMEGAPERHVPPCNGATVCLGGLGNCRRLLRADRVGLTGPGHPAIHFQLLEVMLFHVPCRCRESRTETGRHAGHLSKWRFIPGTLAFGVRRNPGLSHWESLACPG